MNIFTIGFTKKNAEQFFTRLRQPGLVRLLDIRLNNSSQLAGFTKKSDLSYFLRELCNMDYVHLPELAPTQDILDEYKKSGGNWDVYEEKFMQLLANRRVEETINKDLIDGGCFLCSEATPEHCHRRLVAEYFVKKWSDIQVYHL